jgi:hypothetical protein
MAATTVDTMSTALRKWLRTQLPVSAWRGYANLLLDRAKYVGTG